MTRRRGNNEGTIHKRSNGVWRAQISIRGKRLSRNCKTRKECQDWLKEKVKQIDAGLTYDSANITLKEFLEDNLITLESILRPSSIRQYKQITKAYIIPHLGNIKVVDLRPDQVQTFLSKLTRNGLGARTVQITHAVLRRFYTTAVKLGVVDRNPVSIVTPPKPKSKEMSFYDEDQVQRFILTVSQNQPENLALLVLWDLAG